MNDVTTSEQNPQQRLEAAERAMADARMRAEYHGWSDASANAYVTARRELRAADRALDDARAQVERVADRDHDDTEGMGALVWGLGSLLLAAVVVLILTAHGF
jgi:hypothetical protein